jgi:hypothetical protein
MGNSNSIPEVKKEDTLVDFVSRIPRVKRCVFCGYEDFSLITGKTYHLNNQHYLNCGTTKQYFNKKQKQISDKATQKMDKTLEQITHDYNLLLKRVVDLESKLKEKPLADYGEEGAKYNSSMDSQWSV